MRCDSSVEEQDISDTDGGKAFLDCYPLHQLGVLQGELNREILKPAGVTNQLDSDLLVTTDYRSVLAEVVAGRFGVSAVR